MSVSQVIILLAISLVPRQQVLKNGCTWRLAGDSLYINCV